MIPDLKITPVTTTRTRAFCECGGELFSTGVPVSISPLTWHHTCSKCMRVVDLPRSYPLIEYQDTDPKESLAHEEVAASAGPRPGYREDSTFLETPAKSPWFKAFRRRS